MSDLDQQLRDEIIDSMSEIVMPNPNQAREAGFDDTRVSLEGGYRHLGLDSRQVIPPFTSCR